MAQLRTLVRGLGEGTEFPRLLAVAQSPYRVLVEYGGSSGQGGGVEASDPDLVSHPPLPGLSASSMTSLWAGGRRPTILFADGQPGRQFIKGKKGVVD